MNEQDRQLRIIDWLSRQGPAEWHGYVERHDWNSDGTAPLEWIIAQPQCDAATAATIFWMSEPDYYLDGKHDDHEIASLDLAIINRWEDAGFPATGFGFDEGHPAVIDRINQGPHKVPHSLADMIEGGRAFPWYDELPAEIMTAWHSANGRRSSAHVAEPTSHVREVTERPGKLSQGEIAAIREATSPSTIFPPMPSGLKSDEQQARAKLSSIRVRDDQREDPAAESPWSKLIKGIFGKRH